LLLGIDIGGSKIAYAYANGQGEILARTRRPSEPTGDARADLSRIADDIRTLLGEAGAGAEDLVQIGVSVPGPLDAQRRHVVRPPNLPGWESVAVTDWLEEEFSCAVALENDANAAALAEHRFGAGQGARDMVYLTMSTGVGGGLILGGRLHRGRDGNAGEWGHTPVEWPGEVCACGLHGCLEAYIGGAALARRLRAHAPDGSACLTLAGSRDALTPVHWIEAARDGDQWALNEVDRFNRYLARAIVHIAFSLAPEAVVLGTIAVAAGETLCFAPLRALVAEHIWPHQAPSLRILPAELGDDLAYRAGLCVALEAASDN